ncbi:hypothetical protein GCM10009679_01670 [Saccharothrix algeriensis]|uniref:Amidohydrolase-related domain-containing protein n=2 Tax=Catellatospora bangladeshensis TaxID=310355 RepID=A0A8J3JAL7_9ACTN|nr:hypothetical protein Cba03nite_20250 [Catellatospora bangladeshensis]
MDCNVHLWDQRDDPVFWLADRTLVLDMLGDYDSLPDVYRLGDYLAETDGHEVCGVVWSDAGAADPLHAAAWAQRQTEGHDIELWLVTLGDPASAGWPAFVRSFAELDGAAGVRVRLVAALGGGGGTAPADDERLRGHLGLLAEHGLTLTVECTGDQLGEVARLARALPRVRVVVDHFGWPTDLSDGGLRTHAAALKEVAALPNTATRIDAVGTVFGDWTVARVRPWLLSAVDAFGPQRCMLGSDLPIERLRGGFAHLYGAYDQIFAGCTPDELTALRHGAAAQWYGDGSAGVSPR